jgi:hypothetical protein
MMATDLRVVFGSLGHLFPAAAAIQPHDVTDLIDQLEKEYEELQVSTSIAIVCGRKPG